MTKASILKFVERGASAISALAIFHVFVGAGWVSPITSITFNIVVAVVATIVSAIAAVERESAENSK